MNDDFISPSFWKKTSASWIDFVLLIGGYLVLGYISEHIFLEDAYPPPKGMQLYSEHDFAVYWFLVRWSLILTCSYLFFCYQYFGGTLGQKLLGLKLLNSNTEELTIKNIVLRISIVLTVLLLFMVPGPVVAFLFMVLGAEFLNTAFSVMLLLLLVVSILFYVSFTRYNRGKTRSFKDKLSQTVLVDLENAYNKKSKRGAENDAP